MSLSAAWIANVTVNYATADLTATAVSDYGALPSTTLTFLPGETSKTVPVTVNGDTLKKGNERFRLSLSGTVNVSLTDGRGVATIIDEEVPSSPTSTTWP